MNPYNPTNRAYLWRIVKATGIPHGELSRLLRDAGLPLDVDYENGKVYTTESLFREIVLRGFSVGAE